MAINIKTIADPNASKQKQELNFSFNLGSEWLQTPIQAKDRIFFTEQLSLMLETGNNLYTSLVALGKQMKNPEFAKLIISLQEDVSAGKTFAFALSKFPDVFSVSYVSLIGASEQGGFIHKALESLVQMEKQSDELRSTVNSALTYPSFLMVFSLSVVIFVLTVVFPKFEELFSSIEDQLPATTVALMWMSHLIVDYWWLLLGSTMVLAGGLISWRKSPSGGHTIDRWKLNIPLLKDIFIKIYCIQIFQVLSLSLANGVTLVDAAKASETVVKNAVFVDFIRGLRQNVTEGKSFALGFQQAEFIPPIVEQMIETGEQTGNLALVLDRITGYFRRELTQGLALFSRLIEPIMLIFMGVVVGLLVSSIILPIFKLSGATH